jgi:hypothetical protein
VLNLQLVFPFAQAPIVHGCIFITTGTRKGKKQPARTRSGIFTAGTSSGAVHRPPLPPSAWLDDGSPDLATSMEMLRELAADGLRRDMRHAASEKWAFHSQRRLAINSALAEFQNEAKTYQTPVRDARWGPRTYWDEILCRAPARAHRTLLRRRTGLPVRGESGAASPAPRRGALRNPAGWTAAGHGPSRALPVAVQRDLGFAETMGKQAALVVDLEALAGTHNRAETKAARRLVEEGLPTRLRRTCTAPNSKPAWPAASPGSANAWADRWPRAIARREPPPYLGRRTALSASVALPP